MIATDDFCREIEKRIGCQLIPANAPLILPPHMRNSTLLRVSCV